MDIGSEVFDLCMRPLEAATLEERRRRLIPQACGTVLELGAGTGVNLPYYEFSNIRELHLSDPEIREKLQRRAGLDGLAVDDPRVLIDRRYRERVRMHEAGAERLPFPDDYFDSVVFTLVFCMVRNPLAGFAEIRRVLKTTGRAYFIEHVISENPSLRRSMKLLNRPWYLLSGGCNIDRDTEGALRKAGFRIEQLHRSAKGLIISGIASPAA